MQTGWVTSPYAYVLAASMTGDQGGQQAIYGRQRPFSVVAEGLGEADVVVVRIQGETDLAPPERWRAALTRSLPRPPGAWFSILPR